jgi:hypothetical protein
LPGLDLLQTLSWFNLFQTGFTGVLIAAEDFDQGAGEIGREVLSSRC